MKKIIFFFGVLVFCISVANPGARAQSGTCIGQKVSGTKTIITPCSERDYGPGEASWCIDCTAQCKFKGERFSCDGQPKRAVSCPNTTISNTVTRCFETKTVCLNAVKEANGLCPSDGNLGPICNKTLNCGEPKPVPVQQQSFSQTTY